MAIKPFAIQGADLKLGGVNLQAGTTGVVIPGVTHATSHAVEEVNDTGDQTHAFTNGVYAVIDQVIYDVLLADNTSDITAYAVYVLNLDDQNYIDSIELDSRGSYTDAESTTNGSNDMWAYVGTTSGPTDPGNFVASDWIQVPFRPRMRAGEVVTEGGGSSLPQARFAGYLHTDGIGTLTWVPDMGGNGGGPVNQLTSGTAVLSLDEFGTLTFPNLLDTPVGQTTQNYGMGNLFAWKDGNYWVMATGDPDTGSFGLTGIGISPGIESSTYLYLPSDVDSTTTSVSLGNVSGGIQIQTSGNDWKFDNSNLIVPSYAVIATPPVNGNGVYAESYYDSNGNAWGSYIQQDITGSTSTWAWIETNLNSNIPTVFIENQSADGTAVRWTFEQDGRLTLPLANSVIQSVGAGTNTNVTIIASTGSNTSTWIFASTGTLILPQTNAITSARSRRIGRKIVDIEAYNIAGAPYRYVWNNTTNFLSLYYIGSSIIGWTFYTTSDSSSTVTITGIDPLGPWSLAFSGDPGPGPYTAQSPDYVPGHDNPVNIVSSNNTWTFDINGQLTVPGNVVPIADNTHDLGTPDKQWRHIYVSTGSIYLGGVKLSTNNNQLSVQQVTNIGGQETVVQNYALTNADRIVAGSKTFSIDSNGIFTFPNGSLAVGLNHSLNITAGGYINIISDQGSSMSWSNANIQGTPGEILDAYVYAQGDGGAGLDLFYKSLDGIGDTVNSWSLDTDGNLVTVVARVNNPDNSVSYTAGDIVGPDGVSIIHPTASETIPAYAPEGRLWFNSEEGRLYIRYNNQWVDASPPVLPLQVDVIQLTNGENTVTLDTSGFLEFSSGGAVGDVQQTLSPSGNTNLPGIDLYATPDMAWAQLNYANTNYVWVDGAAAYFDVEEARLKLKSDGVLELNKLFGATIRLGEISDGDAVLWVDPSPDTEYLGLWWAGNTNYDQSGYGPDAGINIGIDGWDDSQGDVNPNTQISLGIGDLSWNFLADGSVKFPYQQTNDRTGSGDAFVFAKNPEPSQKIIATQAGNNIFPTVERLIIAGGDGYGTGEGGDIYLWAGRGYDGGDIKVDAGNGTGAGQYGGTIKIRAGNNTATGAYGGYIRIEGGQGSTSAYHGDVRITTAGNNYEWVFGGDNTLTIPSGSDIKRDGVSVLGGGGFATTSTLVNGTYTVALSTTGQLNLPGAANTESDHARIQSANNIDILSNLSLWTFGTDGILTLSTASTILGNSEDPNVYIETSTTATTSTWTFGTNGVLTLPADTPVIKGAGTGTDVTVIATTGTNTATWTFAADGTLSLPQGVTIGDYPGFGPAGSTAALYGAQVYLASTNGNSSIGVENGTPVIANGSTSTWYFGIDGSLALPGSITITANVTTNHSTPLDSTAGAPVIIWTASSPNVVGAQIVCRSSVDYGGYFEMVTINVVALPQGAGSADLVTTGLIGTTSPGHGPYSATTFEAAVSGSDLLYVTAVNGSNDANFVVSVTEFY